MKLEIGPVYLGAGNKRLLRLFIENDLVRQFELSVLSDLESSEMIAYSHQVQSIVLGFIDFGNVEFLRFFPNVTELWIMTPKIENLNGIQYLKNLRVLTIDRPTYRLDILSKLNSLEEFYIEDWRPGIESIFQLDRLRKVHLQKFQYVDLRNMVNWSLLENLQINRGRVEYLDGIPVNLKELELTNLRKLKSIHAVYRCSDLTKFLLEGSKNICSLDGLQKCTDLKFLSISKVGELESLHPLHALKNLEHLFLADGVNVIDKDINALYNLPKLKKLIISKHFDIRIEKILRLSPGCDVIVVS